MNRNMNIHVNIHVCQSQHLPQFLPIFFCFSFNRREVTVDACSMWCLAVYGTALAQFLAISS